MQVLGIIAVVFVLFLFFYLIWYVGSGSSDEVVIVSGSQSGDTKITKSLLLPRSFNQPEGAVFTYSGWILVKDFTVGYGKRRTILNKGECPGIFLDSTSNSLIVAVKTYGSTETILIPDIPAMKWIHFAIVVDQHKVDVYINGMLRQQHTLGQLPDQNDESIVMGPDWSGVLGRVKYYAKSLTVEEIKKQSLETPPSDLQRTPARPQYFDITWYIGRLNSA